jgi:hypothetical protein
MIGKTERKEAARAFRERKPSAGVYAIRCITSGGIWVESSLNLDAAENGQFFQLRNGLHRNKEMQAAWKAEGEKSFSFNVMERLPEDVPTLNLSDLLLERKRYWIEQAKA